MRKKRTTANSTSMPFRLFYARYAGLLWSGAAVLLLCLSVYNSEKLNTMRMQVTDITAPVLSAISAPVAGLSEKINGMTEMGALRAENIRLAEENARLREWYQTALRLEAENQSLRSFLHVSAEPERAYITTRIIGDTGGRFVKSFLLPVGRTDGVESGQAVITADGMIGRITGAGDSTSRVLLLNDLNSRIPVMVEKTHHRAILAGQNTDKPILKHLPSESGVSPGARIVTSGHDGILPPNIPVGIVSAVTEDQITVTPLADMDGIHNVQIIDVPRPQQNGIFIRQSNR